MSDRFPLRTQIFIFIYVCKQTYGYRGAWGFLLNLLRFVKALHCIIFTSFGFYIELHNSNLETWVKTISFSIVEMKQCGKKYSASFL